MMTGSRLRLLGLFLVAMSLGTSVRAVPAFTVTGFNNTNWGASDATLGVAGFTIEDFEDVTLQPGLLIGWDTTAGSVTPVATIPFTFDAINQDPNGDAFDLGAWDGVNTLVNTRTNQSYAYTAPANWGDTLISFTTPATSVGFSLQQNENDVEVYINGSSIGFLLGLTGIAPTGGRYGYIRIDGVGGNTITDIRLANYRAGLNDGWVIDHLAFAAVPEPSTYALWAGLAALLLAWRRRAAA